MLNICDFHKEWIEEGLLEPANIRINILLDPTYMRLSILPPWIKEQVHKRYEEHIDYLKQFDNAENAKAKNIESVIQDYKNILQFMEQERSNELKMWQWKTNKMDGIRNENVFDVFPELQGIV